MPKSSIGIVPHDRKKRTDLIKKYAVNEVFKHADPKAREERLKENILRIIINELQNESGSPATEVRPSDG